MESWHTELMMVARVAAAMVFGGVIGWERELARESAGLRTHMLIAGMAALIVGLGRLLATDFGDEHFRELVQVDPVRLIEAVVAAVGFVGAGTILKRREGDEVLGLTTAASLLMVAGLGIAAGLNHFVLATGATVLCLFVLWVLRVWERRIQQR
jgi:putative Mg2+ transporter-C (MgtC) family protein